MSTEEQKVAFIGHFLSSTVCHILGFVYPGYASFIALESKGKDDDKIWLTYWIVYGLTYMIEFFFEKILSYIPFYWELKIFFILWLQLPQTSGALLLYKKYLEPFLIKNQAQIEKSAQELVTEGLSTLKNLSTEGVKYVAKQISQNEEAKKMVGNVVNTVVDQVVESKKEELLKKVE